jgi:hypothetical protein
MSMNLVAIAGIPAPKEVFDLEPGAWGDSRGGMSGKLVGVGGCGCEGMGAYAHPVGDVVPTDEQKAAFNWLAVGFGLAALGIAYFVLREPARAR